MTDVWAAVAVLGLLATWDMWRRFLIQREGLWAKVNRLETRADASEQRADEQAQEIRRLQRPEPPLRRQAPKVSNLG